ncbi:hypothetical protein NIES2109_00080 [Nostoc sp. HK-01]|nr:hypothetical protein NIES2109_00080 [Nostoc sp. HK-01]
MPRRIRSLQALNFKQLFKIHTAVMSGDKPLNIYVCDSHNLIKNLKFFRKSIAITCWSLADNIVETLLIRQFFSRNDVIKWQFAFKP